MDPWKRIHVSMYPRKLIVNRQEIVKAKFSFPGQAYLSMFGIHRGNMGM